MHIKVRRLVALRNNSGDLREHFKPWSSLFNWSEANQREELRHEKSSSESDGSEASIPRSLELR